MSNSFLALGLWATSALAASAPSGEPTPAEERVPLRWTLELGLDFGAERSQVSCDPGRGLLDNDCYAQMVDGSTRIGQYDLRYGAWSSAQHANLRLEIPFGDSPRRRLLVQTLGSAQQIFPIWSNASATVNADEESAAYGEQILVDVEDVEYYQQDYFLGSSDRIYPDQANHTETRLLIGAGVGIQLRRLAGVLGPSFVLPVSAGGGDSPTFAPWASLLVGSREWLWVEGRGVLPIAEHWVGAFESDLDYLELPYTLEVGVAVCRLEREGRCPKVAIEGKAPSFGPQLSLDLPLTERIDLIYVGALRQRETDNGSHSLYNNGLSVRIHPATKRPASN